jgi:hypothetical protein
MDEYSLEGKVASIYHEKTREYFREVLSNYQNKNYRSAVVMLWSVAVCDLLLKLRHMADLYSDKTANDILTEVAGIQTANPRSPEWELKLVDLVRERTNLLEIGDHQNLVHLQHQRHLSAHPVVNASLELHRPNRDTVRAFIRNVLDGVLTKPPIYTRRVLDDLLQDLAASAPILTADEDKLRTFLEGRYLARMPLQVQLEIFRTLYRLTFRTVNPDCDANRLVNYKAVEYIARKNPTSVVTFMSRNVDFFSQIATNGEPLKYLIYFLARLPDAYLTLDEHAKHLIEHIIQNDPDSRCSGWFLNNDLDTFYNSIANWAITPPAPQLTAFHFEELMRASDTSEWEKKVRMLANNYYCSSGSYDSADTRFANAIRPLLGTYGPDELVDLLGRIERNSQTYHRNRSRVDHREIKQKCDEVLGAAFDFAPYPMFVESIS